MAHFWLMHESAKHPQSGTVHRAWTCIAKEYGMKKLVAIAIAVAVIVASLLILPTVESRSVQVFGRVGLAEGEGGGD